MKEVIPNTPTPVPTIKGKLSVHKNVINLSKENNKGHTKEANIYFRLDAPGDIYVEIYDRTGRLVKTLWSGYKEAGMFEVVWNAVNMGGSIVPAGVYKVIVRTSSWTEKKNIVVIR